MTLKVAWPAALVVPLTVVMLEDPVPWESVTLWPGIGVPEASSSVTVTVDVAVPLSSTEVGLGVTEELVWETGPTPATKETVAVWVMARLDYDVSVAE